MLGHSQESSDNALIFLLQRAHDSDDFATVKRDGADLRNDGRDKTSWHNTTESARNFFTMGGLSMLT